MLLFENASTETFHVIIGRHRHCRLSDDWPSVYIPGDIMHRTTTHFDPIPQGRCLRAQGARESRQQGWVYVDDLTGIGLQYGGTQYLVVAGQPHQIDSSLVQRLGHRGLARRARGVLTVREGVGRYARAPGMVESRATWAIGQYADHARR